MTVLPVEDQAMIGLACFPMPEHHAIPSHCQRGRPFLQSMESFAVYQPPYFQAWFSRSSFQCSLGEKLRYYLRLCQYSSADQDGSPVEEAESLQNECHALALSRGLDNNLNQALRFYDFRGRISSKV